MLTLALALMPSLGGHVLTVGSGQDFADLQSAIDAATDGDTVLVRAGNYTGFVIDGKALTVVVDEGAQVAVNGEARVEHLASGRLLLLSGLATTSTSGYALYLRDNFGRIDVRGGSYRGHASLAPQQPGGAAARITKSGVVRVVGASVTGGNGWCLSPSGCAWGPSSGGFALFARSTALELFDSTLTGGSGGTDWTDTAYDGGYGGHAYESPDVVLFASNSSFRGGNGGSGGEEQGCCSLFGIEAGRGGDGGNGVLLGSTPPGVEQPIAALLDCDTYGGAAGFGGLGYCCSNGANGTPGQPVKVQNGSHTPIADVARVATGPRVVRENTPLALQFQGVAGDRVWMRVESASPNVVGSIPLRVPKPKQLGVVPASGTLAVQVPLAGYGAHTEGLTWFVAFDFIASDGTAHEGTPLAIVIVDATL
ncbi:MAG: hypothetical protein K8S98_03085 [Planctomycetes bacterium]|nr:hypothetical protein [Planctomycetota bacterium]